MTHSDPIRGMHWIRLFEYSKPNGNYSNAYPRGSLEHNYNAYRALTGVRGERLDERQQAVERLREHVDHALQRRASARRAAGAPETQGSGAARRVNAFIPAALRF